MKVCEVIKELSESDCKLTGGAVMMSPPVGVWGRVLDRAGHLDCAEDRTPISFDGFSLGYCWEEDNPPVILYMPNDCIEISE